MKKLLKNSPSTLGILTTKQHFIGLVMVLVASVTILYGVFNLSISKLALGLVDSFIGLLLIGLLFLKNKISFEIRAHFLAAIMLVFLVFLVVDGATGNVGFLWIMMYPPIILYLVGPRNGKWWAMFGQFILVCLAVANEFEGIKLPYERIVIVQFNASYLILVFLSYFAEIDRQSRTQKLVNLQRQMQLVLQHSPVIFFRFDDRGIIGMADGSALDRIGLKTKEIVGKSVLDLYKENIVILEAVKKALGGETVQTLATLNDIDFQVFFSPYFDENDNSKGVVGMAIDQSQELVSKKELSKKLKELETLNKLMVGRELKMANLKKTARSNENDVLPAYMGENLKSIDVVSSTYHASDQQISADDTKIAMINLLEDAKELEEELKSEKLSVENKVIERTKELQSKTAALEKAREQATQGWMQLQVEKAKLNASVEAIPVGLVMVDIDHRILTANNFFKKIIDLDLNAIVLKTTFEEFLTSIGLDFEKTCSHCRQNDLLFKGDDYAYKDKVLKILTTPIYQDKTLIGTAYLIEDETEVKRLQKTRDEFFSVASHELRTPLTAIRGNSQMLQDYYPEVMQNADVKEMVVDIHDASIRLIQIVNDFLDASRLELKKVEMKIEQVVIKEIIEKCMEEINPASVGKTLEYLFKMHAEDNLLALGDRARLQQVMINLLGNAIKFTKIGGVYVDVEATSTLVKIKVTDTGSGMAKDDQSQLFQKFKQVGTNAGLARETSQGSGMGLYISKLIMESMGGQIYLEHSEKEKGSTFAVELPRA